MIAERHAGVAASLERHSGVTVEAQCSEGARL